MDTTKKADKTYAHLYLKNQAVEILKEIFGSLEDQHELPSSLEGAAIVGTIRIDTGQKESKWSRELFSFMEVPQAASGPVPDLLSYVVDKDREVVRNFFERTAVA